MGLNVIIDGATFGFTSQGFEDVREKLLASDASLLTELEHEILKHIVKATEALNLDSTACDADWTSTLKDALANFPPYTDKYLPFPNKRFEEWAKGGVWLCDYVWLDNDSVMDWRKVKSLKLAAESEWKTSEYTILEDFLKLTVIRAEIRLFIYSYSGKRKTSIVDWCRNASSTQLGDRYLLLGMPKTGTFEGRVDAWVVR